MGFFMIITSFITVITIVVPLLMKSDISEKWHYLVNQKKQSAR